MSMTKDRFDEIHGILDGNGDGIRAAARDLLAEVIRLRAGVVAVHVTVDPDLEVRVKPPEPTRIGPDVVKRMIRMIGCEAKTEFAGLIAREAMAHGHGRIVCSCGNGTEPNEPPESGLYVDDDGSVRRTCGSCWVRL